MRWLLILAVSMMPVLAAADHLRKGMYLVAVEVPGAGTPSSQAEICWRGAAHAKMPLGPLGPGPLQNCPGTARTTEGGIEVITKCPAPNVASALTRYRLTAEGFRGWVSTNMDGKEMTVMEKQAGRWVGRC